MALEAELVLAIARDVVYDKKDDVIPLLLKRSGINWKIFKDSLAYHGLVPFAYLSLKKYFYLLPQELVKTLEASYYYHLRRACYLEQKFLELFNNFKEKGVDLIPIKGVALLEDLYAKFPVRPSTDIDVLVKEKDLDGAVKILEGLEYKKNLEGLKESYWRNKQYHFVFTKEKPDKFSPIIELHWDLDYRRYRRQLLPNMFNRLREFTIQDKRIRLLSSEDTFFALALHQRRFGIALSLRDVCDMARLINKFTSTFDWDYILSESKKSKICLTVFFALCQVNFFFKINIPGSIWRELNLSAWRRKIIQRFIEKNTFLADQRRAKSLYLKAHFLLYDSLWEPIDYILNIPQEQFAKFYGLKPYDKKTEFFYRNRIIYIVFKAIFGYNKFMFRNFNV